MITGVVGITFWTDNLERLRHFYEDIMRLQLHAVHDDFINFDLGDCRLNIGVHSGVAGDASDPFRIMPHLGVDDIHAEYDRLAGLGVEFIRLPEQEHWGGWVATIKDPDGNILQLLQLV